jgi:hypothetical protein
MTTEFKPIEGTNDEYLDKFYVEHLGIEEKRYGPFTTPADVRAAYDLAVELAPGGSWHMTRERLMRSPWPEFDK